MKKCLMIAAVMLPVMLGCQKEQTVTPDESAPKLVSKSFTVSMPDTRTYLDDNGKSVVWDEGDVINIIGVTADGTVGQYPFTLKAGDGGKASVTFEGAVGAEDVTFYAVYPNYEIDAAKISTSLLLLKSNLPYEGDNMQQKGYKGGFDPEFGLMVAVADDLGNLPFNHVMSFFKFVIGVDNVTKVTFSTTGDIRFGARVQYNVASGDIDTQSAKKAVDLTPAEGNTFEKDKTYYLAFPTRTGKKIKNLSIAYTNTGGVTSSVSVNNADFLNLIPDPGKIYNIGCPPISFTPVIQAETPAKLAFDAEEGSFTYSISRAPDGAVASASVPSDSWISNVTVSGNTVSFECSKNDAADAEERTAVITLSYEGAEPVEVTIAQGVEGGSSGPVINTYKLYVDNKKELVNTAFGDGLYYNVGTGTSILDCNSNNYFGTATSYTINGIAYQYARKLDNSNPLSFTVSSGASATLKFYCARREETKTTSIKVSDGSTNIVNAELAWADGQAVLYESDLLELTAGKTYSFAKSGDNIGIFYVEVVETINQ